MDVGLVKYDGRAALERAVDLCNGLEGLKPDDNILIKPNGVWGGTKKLPPFGVVTTSVIMENLLCLLKERGFKNIVIGEGTVTNKEVGSTTAMAYKWSGIERVAKKYNVPLIDFNSEPYERVDLDGIKVKIAKRALDADFLINMPVLKTHVQAKVSLGMKNLKGCLALQSKKRFHRHDLSRLIALLNMHLKSSLTIIDGIYAMERGPIFIGDAHRMNAIIAGRDVFSCDIVGAMLLDINPEEVGYLKEFSSLTGRFLDINAVNVMGDKISDMAKKLEWELDYNDIFKKYGISGVLIQCPGETMCSGCFAILSSFSAVFCKDNPNTDFGGVELCAGAEVNPLDSSKKVFLVGDCAIKANRDIKDTIKVKGCPPMVSKTLFKLILDTLPKTKALKILGVRSLKTAGMKLGIYDEVFPAFGRHEPPEFDPGHF